ncbi:MAG: zinc ribbon domain-containing protein [Promethearchaeota archaeon]|jgi:RNA polymerase subunit RPABC4/transcription elongation factor Spt4
MSSQINFSLKNNAEAVYAVLNRKKEFFLVVQNFQGHYLPKVRVVLTGPPEIRLRIKSEWYSGIGNGNKKSRLFAIIPKAEGIFTLTATLSSKNIILQTLPVEVRVGNVQIPQKSVLPQPQVNQSIQIPVTKLNCPFCGEGIESDAKFCPICGSNLEGKLNEEKKSKICSNCAQELPLDAKFCASCGEKIE